MQIQASDRLPQWRPPSPEPAVTGVGAVDADKPVSADNTLNSMDRQGQGAVLREPDKPSAAESPNRDWTEIKKQEVAEEPAEPPKEPISKQLLEFIQSMWRASGTAIDMAQEVNAKVQQERVAQAGKQEPLTYSPPKAQRRDL